MAETKLRIGQGYDVHRLVEGRKLILGGVEIPWTLGLLGHSDADVLIHAIMDALLGAAGLGDIGKAFPDSDPALEGVSSVVLLDRTMEILHNAGYQVVNVDATIVAQRPKLAAYIPAMRALLAEHLGVEVACANVKATTEEKLGFTGDSSGMAAQAVALLEKVS
jgi:2-C-methyl-D-erythritol 2,4-cyclodiphosphate synthase